MDEIDRILDDANIARIANDLLKKFSISVIDRMTEEELKNDCSSYDAAVVVAVARQIEINKKRAN